MSRPARTLPGEYEGVIVARPPARLTEAERRAGPNDPAWYALSREELTHILPQCPGKPMMMEHQHATRPVGVMTGAGYNTDGDAVVRFRWHTTAAGALAKQMVDRQTMTGLSLCHDRRTLDVKECSLCFAGARPGTGVTALVAASAADAKNAPEYKPPSVPTGYTTGYVQATFRPVAAPSAPSMAQAPPNVTYNFHAPSMPSGPAASAPMASAPAPVPTPAADTAMAPAPPLSGAPPPSQQQQPPASAVPQQGPAKRARTEPQAPTPTHAEQKQPQQQSGKAASAPPTTDAARLVQLLAQHNEPLKPEHKMALMDALMQGMEDQRRAAREAAQLKRKLTQSEKAKQTLQDQFAQNFLPLMQRLSNQDLTPQQVAELERAARSENSSDLLTAFSPALVAASRALTHQLDPQRQAQAAGPPLDPAIQQRLQRLQALQQQTAYVPPAPTATLPWGTSGWTPAATATAPAPWGAMDVAASARPSAASSASSAAAAAMPRAPTNADHMKYVQDLMKQVPATDEVPKSSLATQRQMRQQQQRRGGYPL